MSSTRPRSDSGSGPATVQTGATTATPTRKRRPWWLWALLALVALAILVFSLAQCGDNDTPSATAGATPSAAAPAPGGAAAAAPNTSTAGLPGAAAPDAGTDAGAAGTGQASLSADGTSLPPLAQAAGAGDGLTSQVGKAVTARGVLVQSVPADEGFWVGEDNTDRVWVQLNGNGESGYTVKQGDRVDFTGTMTAHEPAFAGQVGVDAAEGADQLTQEAAHVAVDKSVVALSAA